jgi:hypothetical protein
MLEHLGFPPTFRDWVSALLASASSRVLLNGLADNPIKHGRGLRQGDPLARAPHRPATYILRKATQQGHFHLLRGRSPIIRTSLYADDAAIFMAPYKEDITLLASTLDRFGKVTNLVTNCAKSQVALIKCHDIGLQYVLQPFPAKLTNFPMWYLGLRLSFTRLKIIHPQYLEDKVAGKLVP